MKAMKIRPQKGEKKLNVIKIHLKMYKVRSRMLFHAETSFKCLYFLWPVIPQFTNYFGSLRLVCTHVYRDCKELLFNWLPGV